MNDIVAATALEGVVASAAGERVVVVGAADLLNAVEDVVAGGAAGGTAVAGAEVAVGIEVDGDAAGGTFIGGAVGAFTAVDGVVAEAAVKLFKVVAGDHLRAAAAADEPVVVAAADDEIDVDQGVLSTETIVVCRTLGLVVVADARKQIDGDTSGRGVVGGDRDVAGQAAAAVYGVVAG